MRGRKEGEGEGRPSVPPSPHHAARGTAFISALGQHPLIQHFPSLLLELPFPIKTFLYPSRASYLSETPFNSPFKSSLTLPFPPLKPLLPHPSSYYPPPSSSVWVCILSLFLLFGHFSKGGNGVVPSLNFWKIRRLKPLGPLSPSQRSRYSKSR